LKQILAAERLKRHRQPALSGEIAVLLRDLAASLARG
jgi:hypothetical protein